MARSPEELYAEIARLPAPERLRLAARILNELTAEDTSPPTVPRRSPRPQGNGKLAPSPGTPAGRPRSGDAARTAERGTPSREAAPASSDAGKRKTLPGAAAVAPRFLVVDGSNLLGRLPGFELDSAESRERLALRLQEYAHAHPSLRVVLYFDGQKASAIRRGGIEIRYSPPSRPADYFILDYLRRLTPDQRDRAQLVTADRDLAAAARALGAAVQTPEQFQHQIAAPPRPPRDRGLSPAEVEEWLEYFGHPREER